MHLVLDASPLIYLAKLDAFDVLEIAGHFTAVPPSVYAEAARPELAFRHPEVAIVERARIDGRIVIAELDDTERQLAADLADRYGGLHAGELDVLALGQVRGWSVCFHERQATRLAGALGVASVHLIELLVGGTPDGGVLERRVREFARMTNLTMTDLDALLNLIRGQR